MSSRDLENNGTLAEMTNMNRKPQGIGGQATQGGMPQAMGGQSAQSGVTKVMGGQADQGGDDGQRFRGRQQGGQKEMMKSQQTVVSESSGSQTSDVSRQGGRQFRKSYDRGGQFERRGHRFDRRTFGDERRGRRWYQSFRSRFWSPGFIWPRATVFTTFFTGLIPQLEAFGIPQDEYQSLLAEIQQLQTMLAQQSPDGALNEALRRRLAEVIGRLVDLVPGIDVQGLFEGGGGQP